MDDDDEKKNAIQHLVYCISVMSRATPTQNCQQQQLNNHCNSLPCEMRFQNNERTFMQVNKTKVKA